VLTNLSYFKNVVRPPIIHRSGN